MATNKKTTKVVKNLSTLDTEAERWTGKPLPVHPDILMVEDRLGREAKSSEEVEKVLAEIAAENAAKDAELDQHVKEAKAALRASRGKTIDPARAKEIAEEKAATTVGNQPAKPKQVRAKAIKPVVEKPAKVKKEKVAKQPTVSKVPEWKIWLETGSVLKVDTEVQTGLNPQGHAWITPEIVLQVFADKTQWHLKNAEIAKKHNIGSGYVSTILSGPEWFRFLMAKKGMVEYPTRSTK